MRSFSRLAVMACLVSCGGGDGKGPDPTSNPPTAVLRLASGDDQRADPGTILTAPVVVQVTDPSGAPLNNFSVTFTVQAGGGLVASVPELPNVPATTVASDVNGMARILWQLGPDTVGTQVVRVSAATAQASVETSAHAVNSYFVVVAAGNEQVSKAGDALGTPLVARTQNAKGQNAVGVRVQWSLSSSAATFLSADTLSDANGVARAQINVGGLLGVVVTTATVRSGSTIFRTSVQPGDPASLDILPRSVTLAMEGMMDVVAVKVRDRFGNEVPDIGVGRTISDTTIAADWGVGRIRANEAGLTSWVFRAGSLIDSIPVRVLSFDRLFVGDANDCGITKLNEGLCWSRTSAWDHGEVQGSGSIAAAAFSEVTCLASLQGVTTCWGENGAGQLGGGPSVTDFSRSQSNRVTVLGGHRFVQLTVGMSHVCGLEQDGRAYCWGVSYLIGSDSTTQSCGPLLCTSEPAPVRGGLRFAQISTLGAHTCGVTLAGEGYCWGQADVGQLGSKPLDDCPNAVVPCAGGPQLVSGTHQWTQIASGRYHNCGLATDGETYCWGANGTGLLGAGPAAPDSSTIPLRVIGGYHFASLALGLEQSCGLTSDGRAFCWGAGQSSQPVARQPERRFSAIATSRSGGDGFCGISAAGGIHCQFFPEFIRVPQDVADRLRIPRSTALPAVRRSPV